MGGDPLRQAKAGDLSPFVNQLATVNAVLRASSDARRARGPGASGPGAGNDPLTPSDTILIQNATGGTLPALSIVTPSGYVTDPASLPYVARRKPCFTVAAPGLSTDPVFVVLDGIPYPGIGRAVAAGVAVAKVEVTDSSHRFAVPVSGSTDHLTSAESGPVYLLASERPEGTYYTQVILGAPPVAAFPLACGTFNNDPLAVSLVDGVWVADRAVSIPEAGWYLLSFSVTAEVSLTTSPDPVPSGSWGAGVAMRVWDCGGGFTVPGTYGMVVTVQAGTIGRGTCGMTVLAGFSAPTSIQLQAELGVGWGTLIYANMGGGIWSNHLNFLKVAPWNDGVIGPCAASGCLEAGGSGSGGGPPDPGSGESPFDLGTSVTLTFSGGTGDCDCLDMLTVDLTQVTPHPGDVYRWESAAGAFDASGCPNGTAAETVGLAYTGDGWRLIGLYDAADCTFVSQDEGTLTVVFTADASNPAGVCTGTFTVTAQGA